MKRGFRLRLIGVLVCGLVLGWAWPAGAVQLKVGEAPFDDLALTVQAIETAQSSLLVNIYDLSSPEIASALVDRIKAGLQVEVLEEGQPVGGLTYTQRNIQAELATAMAQSRNGDHLFEMKAAHRNLRRFNFDHAKYIVADGQSVLIGSENYSSTGNPKPGAVGNRGWEVLIRDSALAQQFTEVFRGDVDSSHGDVVDLSEGPQDTTSGRAPSPHGIEQLKSIARGLPILDSDAVKAVLSPDNSMNALGSLISSARSSIDVEQMTLDPNWGRNGGKSPLLQALIAAAERGVQVRVLLNDESVFNRPGRRPSKPKNAVAVQILNSAAAQENLKLEARVADVRAMGVDYIHNKGMLIDGQVTLVSSINWDENSVLHNREAGVAIYGSAVFSHYESLFSHDWQVSPPQSGLASSTPAANPLQSLFGSL